VHQFPLRIGLHSFHESIGDSDGEVEVAQIAAILGVDESLNIGMVAAQHAHLRTAARTGGLHGFATAVEYAHVRHRAAGAAVGAFYQRIFRANGGKVIADTPATAHGFGGLLQRIVDARLAIAGAADCVAHGLHKAIDECCLQRRSCCGIDAPARDKSILERPQEFCFPCGRIFFNSSQPTCHARAYVMCRDFAFLAIFFQQDFRSNLLFGHGSGGIIAMNHLVWVKWHG